MARVTVEDCLEQVPNRFALTILGSRRARALAEGRGEALVDCDNKEGVTALREISDGRVRFREDVDRALTDFIEEQRRQLRVTTTEHTFLEAASLRAFEDGDDDDGSDDSDTDVEELPSDPERLNAAAKDGSESGDDDDDDSDGGDGDDSGDSDDDSSDEFEGTNTNFDDEISDDDVSDDIDDDDDD